MSRRINLAGQTFGRLTVIKDIGSDHRGERLWLCKCECGEQVTVLGGNLRSGHSRSCGCLRMDTSREKATTHGLSRSKSGAQKQARLYSIWSDVKRRCFNPQRSEFKQYGGRGITICDEWLEFEPFYKWALSSGYRDNLTLERDDVNSNYEPCNCKWIPLQDQPLNTTRSVKLTHNGRTLTMTEWAREIGINVSTLRNRLKSGWSVDKALTQPLRSDISERSSRKKANSSEF